MRHPAAVVILGLLILGGAAQIGCEQQPASILDIATDTVRLKLLDAVTALAMGDRDVEIRSYNGIVCGREPCPNDAKRWNGRSDAAGYVVAPVDVLQVMTYIGTPTHRADLIDDSYEAADEAWAVEMFPRDKPAELDFHPLDLKLIDARSLRPIADTPVRIDFGGTGRFEGTTNSLGYIFVPVEALLGDTAVARPFEPEQAVMIVHGYRTAQTDFARANRKVLMKRR